MFENMFRFEAETGGAGAGSGNPGDTTATGAGAEAKSYTQAELDRMFAERARQAEGWRNTPYKKRKRSGTPGTGSAIQAMPGLL